eukprot:9908994-Alexandrium_andersonii.AAC.1
MPKGFRGHCRTSSAVWGARPDPSSASHPAFAMSLARPAKSHCLNGMAKLQLRVQAARLNRERAVRKDR